MAVVVCYCNRRGLFGHCVYFATNNSLLNKTLRPNLFTKMHNKLYLSMIFLLCEKLFIAYYCKQCPCLIVSCLITACIAGHPSKVLLLQMSPILVATNLTTPQACLVSLWTSPVPLIGKNNCKALPIYQPTYRFYWTNRENQSHTDSSRLNRENPRFHGLSP